MWCQEALCLSLMDMKLCVVYESGLRVTVRLRIILQLNIGPASTGIGLPEVAHVLCVQVLVCVVMFW